MCVECKFHIGGVLHQRRLELCIKIAGFGADDCSAAHVTHDGDQLGESRFGVAAIGESGDHVIIGV